jgi:hypothetical protein
MGLSGFGRRDRQIYSHGLLGKIVSSGIKSLGRRCHKNSCPFSVATAHLIYDQIKSSMGAGRKWPLPQTLTGADLFSRFIIRLPRQLDTATLVCSGRASSMGAGRKWPSRRFPFPFFKPGAGRDRMACSLLRRTALSIGFPAYPGIRIESMRKHQHNKYMKQHYVAYKMRHLITNLADAEINLTCLREIKN